MNEKDLHSNKLAEESRGFFSKGEIEWEKSEAEIWKELEQKIEQPNRSAKTVFLKQVVKYAAAAVLFLILGFGAVTLFYAKTIETAPGQHLTVSLPDGSAVELNAVSKIKYYPLKWKWQRHLYLSGEAFFNVKKGKSFEVISNNGITRVLGTTFNVYSRDNTYRVTCLTGKVNVQTSTQQSVVLSPGAHAEIQNGKLVVEKDYNTEKVVSWKNNRFFFAGATLKEVAGEIERQYGVTITIEPQLQNRRIAINFDKKENVEEVLEFICKTMQISYVKQSENVFLIVKKH